MDNQTPPQQSVPPPVVPSVTPQIQTVPPPPNQPSPTSLLKNKKMSIIAGIVLLLAILGGSTYVLHEKQTKQFTSPTTISPTPSHSPSISQPTKGAEMDSYINKKYGFTLKYPLTWIAFEFTKDLTDKSDLQVYFRPTDEKAGNHQGWDVLLQVYKTNTSLDEFINTFCGYESQPCNNTAKTTSVTYGTITGKEIILPGPVETKAFFFSHEGNIYKVNIAIKSPNDVRNQKARDTILSSFTFIQKTNENAADVKTYTGGNYSFQYPVNAQATANNDAITLSPPYEAPYDRWYELTITEKNNTDGLDAKQAIEAMASTLENNPGPEGKSVATKIRSSLKQYSNNSINGWYAKFGWDSDFITIVMTKNNKIYTFTMVGDQGVTSEDNIKTLDKILATFTFTN